MKKMTLLSLSAATLMASMVPAQAGFYYEGLMPFTEAPNCNDPYATTCGRYGQVPHIEGSKDVVEKNTQMMPMAVEDKPEYKAPKAGRTKTREGLDK